MDIPPQSPRFVPLLAFVGMTGLACTAGFVPAVLLIDRPQWLLWVLAISLAVSLTQLSSLRGRTARPVTALERAAVFISGLFLGSISALFCFVGYGVGRLVQLAAGLGAAGAADPTMWARTGAIAMGILFLLTGVAQVSENLGKAFFPKTGVGNAPLYPRLTWRSLLGWGSLVVLGAIMLIFLDAEGHRWAPLTLEILLIVGTATLNSEFEPPKLPIRERAIQAIRSLVQACDFRIIERLQVGDSRLDKLISVFDLIAHRDGDVVAIQFKTGGGDQDGSELTWTDATAIPGALWAVRKLGTQLNIDVHDAKALIVLAGRQADASLKEFAEEESVQVVELDLGTIQTVLDDSPAPDQLRRLAGKFLGLSAAPSANGASGAKA